VVWGANTVLANNVVWEANVVWGDSSMQGFNVVWGANVVWGLTTSDTSFGIGAINTEP
jgi:hypothetical protein